MASSEDTLIVGLLIQYLVTVSMGTEMVCLSYYLQMRFTGIRSCEPGNVSMAAVMCARIWSVVQDETLFTSAHGNL